MPSGPQIYQIKVTLRHSKPPIWRRILVPSDITLAELHDILQAVMGWCDAHLHQFIVEGTYYGVPDPDDYVEVKDERQMRLNQIVPGVKYKFVYEYDFGDSWEHELLVEKILPLEEGVRYPSCIKGKRSCPPEDVGGVWGYALFLEAMRDPEHPEHEDYVEWIGDEFDSEAFDLDEINAILSRL